ncbi:MAG: TetR family transcriptional regulator [Mycobacteriaceae bacterium]|nr:TetR family transcriptional regulator [Mycobacteriaceae bacterium]
MKTAENARLSRGAVTDAALALVDAEGLGALTIRRLATDLGVTPMALYWHFKNKDELLGGVRERIWSQIDARRDPALSLEDQFRALVESLVSVLRSHPAAALLLNGKRNDEPSPGFLAATESGLSILTELGLSLEEAAAVCSTALRGSIALVMGEPGAPEPNQSPEQTREMLRRKRLALESVSAQRYPHVVAAAGPMTACDDPDVHYAFGVDFLMGGLARLLAR